MRRSIMNHKWTKTALLTGFSVIVAVFALNTGSFAGRGCGYGNYGYRDNADIKKERTAFLNETEELRENLFNKEQQLRTEMDKESPDISIAMNIQKEISELRAELDQRWIEYASKMKKLNPNFGSRYGYMGRGSGSGGGYCW